MSAGSQRTRSTARRRWQPANGSPRNPWMEIPVPGPDTSPDSRPEPHAILLRLRRTADRPESAADRRSAMRRMPRHCGPAAGARGRTRPCGRGGGRVPLRTGSRTGDSRSAVDTAGRRLLSRPVEPRAVTDASRASCAVRRADDDGHGVHAAHPRRRPLPAARGSRVVESHPHRAATAPGSDLAT